MGEEHAAAACGWSCVRVCVRHARVCIYSRAHLCYTVHTAPCKMHTGMRSVNVCTCMWCVLCVCARVHVWREQVQEGFHSQASHTPQHTHLLRAHGHGSPSAQRCPLAAHTPGHHRHAAGARSLQAAHSHRLLLLQHVHCVARVIHSHSLLSN